MHSAAGTLHRTIQPPHPLCSATAILFAILGRRVGGQVGRRLDSPGVLVPRLAYLRVRLRVDAPIAARANLTRKWREQVLSNLRHSRDSCLPRRTHPRAPCLYLHSGYVLEWLQPHAGVKQPIHGLTLIAVARHGFAHCTMHLFGICSRNRFRPHEKYVALAFEVLQFYPDLCFRPAQGGADATCRQLAALFGPAPGQSDRNPAQENICQSAGIFSLNSVCGFGDDVAGMGAQLRFHIGPRTGQASDVQALAAVPLGDAFGGIRGNTRGTCDFSNKVIQSCCSAWMNRHAAWWCYPYASPACALASQFCGSGQLAADDRDHLMDAFFRVIVKEVAACDCRWALLLVHERQRANTREGVSDIGCTEAGLGQHCAQRPDQVLNLYERGPALPRVIGIRYFGSANQQLSIPRDQENWSSIDGLGEHSGFRRASKAGKHDMRATNSSDHGVVGFDS